MTANTITVSRMLFSLLLLFFSPQSYAFAGLYLLCGITDVLDGFVARKLHTESEKGAMLDTVADLLFAVIYAIRILPGLKISFWIWVWIAGIAAVKTAGIVCRSIKEHRLSVEHSFLNRLTGALIFLLPLTVRFVNITYSAAFVCAVATCAAIEEICKMIRKK